MAAVTICSDFGAQENKNCHCFHFFPIYLPWGHGIGCHDLSFFECWVFKPAFSLSSFTSSRGSLVSLHFLLLEWYHLHISFSCSKPINILCQTIHSCAYDLLEKLFFNAMKNIVKWSEVKVAQSCLTLCNPMDYTVHGILRPEYWSG